MIGRDHKAAVPGERLAKGAKFDAILVHEAIECRCCIGIGGSVSEVSVLNSCASIHTDENFQWARYPDKCANSRLAHPKMSPLFRAKMLEESSPEAVVDMLSDFPQPMERLVPK